jgi:hypothetical protein
MNIIMTWFGGRSHIFVEVVMNQNVRGVININGKKEKEE